MFLDVIMKHDRMIIVLCVALNVMLASGNRSFNNYCHTADEDTHRILCVFDNFPTGASLSDQVHQTPPDIFINNRGETTTIKCSHSIDNYDRILWYKQTDDGKLQFLGYMLANSPNPEPGLGVKMEGSANKGQTCTLTTEKMNSSAVYFCAARLHSATYHRSSVQKPPHQKCFHLSTEQHTCAPSSEYHQPDLCSEPGVCQRWLMAPPTS